jgi:hypothetical protein
MKGIICFSESWDGVLQPAIFKVMLYKISIVALLLTLGVWCLGVNDNHKQETAKDSGSVARQLYSQRGFHAIEAPHSQKIGASTVRYVQIAFSPNYPIYGSSDVRTAILIDEVSTDSITKGTEVYVAGLDQFDGDSLRTQPFIVSFVDKE